jgi:hypothetical protein
MVAETRTAPTLDKSLCTCRVVRDLLWFITGEMQANVILHSACCDSWNGVLSVSRVVNSTEHELVEVFRASLWIIHLI